MLCDLAAHGDRRCRAAASAATRGDDRRRRASATDAEVGALRRSASTSNVRRDVVVRDVRAAPTPRRIAREVAEQLRLRRARRRRTGVFAERRDRVDLVLRRLDRDAGTGRPTSGRSRSSARPGRSSESEIEQVARDVALREAELARPSCDRRRRARSGVSTTCCRCTSTAPGIRAISSARSLRDR